MPLRPISPIARPPIKDTLKVDVRPEREPLAPPDRTQDVLEPSTPSLSRDPIFRPPPAWKPPLKPPLKPPTDVPVTPRPPADRPPIWDGVGMIPPSFRLEYPDGLRRPPTVDDLTVLWGLDNRTPDEVVALVRTNLSGPLHPENRGFIDRSVRIAHRAFTVAVNNAFTPNTPFQTFKGQFPADARFELLGTLAMLHPTLVRVKVPGEAEPQIYELTPAGYQRLSKVPYPVIMETPLSFHPALVAPSYPSWSMAALSQPLTVVTEPR